MKYTQVKIGGKNRPVRATYAMQLVYEAQTGRNAEIDLREILVEHEAAVKENRLPAVNFSTIVDLVFASIATGYRTVGLDIDFDTMDVSEWVATDQDAVTEIFSQLGKEFFAIPGAIEQPKKKMVKKMKPMRATGGIT